MLLLERCCFVLVLILQKAIGITSTIATIIVFWWIKNSAVMCRYNRAHITHTTITKTYLNPEKLFCAMATNHL